MVHVVFPNHGRGRAIRWYLQWVIVALKVPHLIVGLNVTEIELVCEASSRQITGPPKVTVS